MTSSTVPQGFTPVADSVEPSVNYPVVAPVAFAEGIEIVYGGSRVVGEDKNVMHIVARPSSPEKRAILWGSAMLNRKLARVGQGEILFLRYLGKEPHPSFEGKEQHVWEVGRSSENASAPAPATGGAPRTPLTSF